jgi:hypothetical protein
MATAVEDLWPADIESAPDQLPPITILKQQAAMLGQRTRNLLEGQVETRTEESYRRLRHVLFIVAPALDFYRYPLLEVEHAVVGIYPVTITASWNAPREPEEEGIGVDESLDRHYKLTASDESQFKNALKDLLGHEETKKIIGSLLAQSGVSTPAF